MIWNLCCAGYMTRWNNYLNIPKHLIKINNEILLHRTIRLINAIDNENTINVFILNNDNKEKYKIEKTNLVIINENIFKYQKTPLALETLLIYNIKKELIEKENQVLLFGDTFFTDDTIRKIYEYNDSKEITFFGRKDASLITKKDYGEIYGILYNMSKYNILNQKFILLKKFAINGYLPRIKHWELYKILNNIPLNTHKTGNNFVEINDLTEDFDFPEDYDKWIIEYNNKNKI